MQKLIEALTIFLKYAQEDFPTHCEHDILMVPSIDEDAISAEDKAALDRLGFFWSDEYECWASFRYGSC